MLFRSVPLLHRALPQGTRYSRPYQAVQRTSFYGRRVYRAYGVVVVRQRQAARRLYRLQKLRKGLSAADKNFGNDEGFFRAFEVTADCFHTEILLCFNRRLI